MKTEAEPSSAIALSPAVRWREFRRRVLPVLVFGSGVLLVAILWPQIATPTSFVAEAETVMVGVSHSQSGIVANFRIAPLTQVTAGEPIARLHTVDPRVLDASLRVIRAEIDCLRSSLEPAIPQQRADLERRRLQLDWMKERVALATLRGQLELAEIDLARQTGLFEKGLVAVEIFETAKNLRDRLVNEVDAQAELVVKLAPSEDGSGLPASGDTASETLAAAVRVQEEKLRLAEAQLAPVALIAPISGVVQHVHHRSGECLPAGEALVDIVAERPERIVGFVRQPVAFEPRLGMAVEVRTRTSPRSAHASEISGVGACFEPIPTTLLAAGGRLGSADLGLRVEIAPPQNLQLRPGEQVEIVLSDNGS